jgi:hypothetical protein
VLNAIRGKDDPLPLLVIMARDRLDDRLSG